MIVTEKLPVPPVRGGAIQTYVAAVAPHLARTCDITILGVTDPLLPDHETVGGIHFVRIPGGDLDTYQDGVTAFLEANSFDLIHLFNRPRLVPAVRAAAPQARLVLSMHNDMFLPQKIDPDTAREAITAVECIVTVSDYVGRTIARMYPEAEPKLRTIYSGVDLERFSADSGQAGRIRSALRREHGLDGKKVILCVGRLSPKKGADILVRAMPAVARRHPDAALVLVGSKWYGEDKISDYVAYVRALAARSPVPVITTGFVDADKVHHWFWAGDLFVCASQWEEPLARVHYEAMAAGLPIITTARGGNPEVVAGQGNGVIVDRPEDPQAFADAINALLSDRGRRSQLGGTGRSMAEQQFGWDRVAADIAAVWQ
jgi:spore coat protein SA